MSRRRRRARAQEARLTQEVANRAIRRLDLLEWVMLAGMAGVAIAGGFFVAALLAAPAGLSFRPMWVMVSLLLFGVPGAIAMRRMRRDERELSAKIQELSEIKDG